MQIRKTGVKAVDALYGVDFTGDVIPHAWYSVIKTETGKPDMIAIAILAEILYWHRPREECDESDPGIIKISKRFKADLLQLSYGQLNKKFGFSKDQSRRAMDRLEKLGLIKRHFRTIETASGNKLGNVMYVELFSDRLIELTYPDGIAAPYRKNPTRVSDKTDEVIGKNQIADGMDPNTNTKNTTEINNKDYTSIYQTTRAEVRDQVKYEYLIADRRTDIGMIDNMIDIITEVNISKSKYHLINGELIPAAIVKEKMATIDKEVLEQVVDNVKSVEKEVINVKGYLLTALYNTAMTYETDLEMKVRNDMKRREMRAWQS